MATKTKAKGSYMDGACASLRKSINEVEGYLKGLSHSPAGSLRDEFRETIGKLAQQWFKRGYRRGCMETMKKGSSTGKLPKSVSYDAKRDFFEGSKKPVSITWKAKKKAG